MITWCWLVHTLTVITACHRWACDYVILVSYTSTAITACHRRVGDYVIFISSYKFIHLQILLRVRDDQVITWYLLVHTPTYITACQRWSDDFLFIHLQILLRVRDDQVITWYLLVHAPTHITACQRWSGDYVTFISSCTYRYYCMSETGKWLRDSE